MAAIILQIATHYHKYQILTPTNFNSFLSESQPNIGYLSTHFDLDVPKFRKIFPKKDSLWISTVREVSDQVNSFIRFLKFQQYYRPDDFTKTLQLFESGKVSEIHQPLLNGGITYILYQCRQIKDFEKFKLCAENVSSEFDLVIPINRINEGLIMLQKLTCLPLSDFAYINKKVSASDFKMSEQNMSALLSHHKQAVWFYNQSSSLFDKKFDEFQSQYCDSYNCKNEIDQLKEENRKLEESCGISRSNSDRFAGINLNWDKLRRNDSLAIRCLSFGVDDGFHEHFDVYNKYVREKDEKAVNKIAKEWINMTIKLSLY